MSDTPISKLEYLPAPSKPRGFDDEIAKIAGLAPNNEPYLRVSWAMDVMENWGDIKVHRYPDSASPPKYVGMPFFVLEGWQSPDVYNRAEWEKNKDILGEFPRNGVWDYIEFFRDAEGAFLPLGELALSRAREWRFWKTKGHKRAISDILDQRNQRRMLQEARFAAQKQKIDAEFLEQFIAAGEAPENTAYSLPAAKDDKFKQTSAGLYIPK